MTKKIKGLFCKECKKEYPAEALHVCEFCFGPLEVAYNYDLIKSEISREKISRGPKSLWRYIDLLPVEGDPTAGLNAGYTPMIHAKNLGTALGLDYLYLKNDTVNCLTLSFKDRVVAVALTRAKELGFDTVACASTGNLANSVAAHAAEAGFRCFVFIPSDLESGKILGNLIYKPNVVGVQGTYDDVNRLCSEIAGEYPWAFVNINIRPYYSEGSKTLAYETMEYFDWSTPDHVVVPIASGSLLTKISKGFGEFVNLGLISGCKTLIHGAQAEGCGPVATAFKEKRDFIKPVKPKTIAKSLAIGNPADGFYALRVVRESGGIIDDVTDDEIIDGMKLLAETQGIFTETAGGVTVAVLKKLAKRGVLKKGESTVAYITGNGLKTQEAVSQEVGKPWHIQPNLKSFQDTLKKVQS
ncbi:MAG: threonine synthase [Nitrospira sp.]|nr:threonine synthase [Candidatus Manganitrophaceae bacterium]HIL35064.1 threonine synthase [Candidatus Manganitrophaceae bacterium]